LVEMRPEGKQSFGGDGQHLSTLYRTAKACNAAAEGYILPP